MAHIKSGDDQNKRLDNIPPETISFLHILKESAGSISSFFGVGYSILIIISITYNLGYFKNINPQFTELMVVGDYVNDTLNNLWLFIIFWSLALSSSLGAAKKHTDAEFPIVVTSGIIVALVTIYSMLTGELENKFFYIIKGMAPNIIVYYLYITILLFFITLLSIVAYKFSYEFAQQRMPKYTPSLICIFVFIFIILLPYALGAFKSSYEKDQIIKGKFNKSPVNILTNIEGYVLKNVYIVKELDKGLIIREDVAGLEFIESKYAFIHWNRILQVYYTGVV